ncbi:AP endonuclease [Aspergillus campestris IBT 28561]|uniref:Apurinic-apyrimidinic endonuclease 1 n=1 Tax=Aspergillus campestris (strain IBT 28561) TaxID=1392248 RepID=A0A2I1CZS6_ASPC2|nr:AP endonuclease [Aspergillus campestris IBT 28561]PKY03133.1 AP endonuclease [Aspergillus campestris IBT 28561]
MPRVARKAASSAISPTASPSKGSKRQVDSTEPSSPLRRSKRTKAHEGLPSLEVKEEPEQDEVTSTNAALKKTARGRAVKVSIKEEKIAEEDTTVSVADEEAQTKVDKPEEKPAPAVKTTKKRKTKKEIEAEMVPLRARTQGLRMCVGAHVSAAKGVFNSINNSVHIGGNAFALFLKSQRKWDNPPLQDDHRDQFRRLCTDQKYDGTKHILPHGSYLVNLAQEDKAKAKQAYDSFLEDLLRCEALGITLYNFHPGSANQSPFPSALTRLAKALTNALAATTTVVPVLETMCGHGSTIGGNLSDFRTILSQIPAEYHPRIGICIDTCHSFAAGYDLTTPTGFTSFLQEFEDQIGLQHLRALHLNDSKAPRGSNRDLHANIGTGFLGLRAFHNVMNEPRFENLPMILETPIDRPPPPNSTSKSTAAVSDPAIWAREIELLESLIGMDPEGAEFRALEAQLADEGKEVRAKHQEQYERKMEAEEKKRLKKEGGKSGQKTLMEMMNGAPKRGKTAGGKKVDDGDDDEHGGSEDEGCQSHAEED